jgi:hypothetical protein
VQALAIALAASLYLGPAPASPSEASESSPSEPDRAPGPDDSARTEAPEPFGPLELPNVDGSAADAPAAADPAADPGPAPEPSPEPTPASPPPPTLTAAPDSSAAADPIPAPLVRDRLGCDGKQTCRRMTVAGIVVGSLGLAALGTGIGLVVKPDEIVPERPTFVTSTRPAGLVTLTLGAGVTLTAVLMLIAAHKGYKQRGDQARAIRFDTSPGFAGLRF